VARGIYIEFRHQTGCTARGEDPRRCGCSPTVRPRLVGGWGESGRLPKGWAKADVDAFEIEAMSARVEHASGRRIIERNTVPLLRDWGEDWLRELELLAEAEQYSLATLSSYRSIWRNHLLPDLGDHRLNEITEKGLLMLRAKKLRAGVNPSYVTQIFFILSGMLTDAIPQHLDHNPASKRSRRRGRSGVAEARAASVPRIMDVDLARALLTVTDWPLHDMILLALTTGMRRSEIMGLKWWHITFHDKRIYVAEQRQRFPKDKDAERGPAEWRERLPKNRGDRKVLLYSALGDRLLPRAERADEDAHVFLDPDHDQPFADAKMQKVLNEVWESIGPRPRGHSWHVLRHSFATLLDQHGVRGHVIDLLMGHTRPGVQARYQHVMDREIDAIEPILAAAYGTVEVPESVEVARA
jgi:integrase